MLMSDTKALSQFIKKGIAGEDIVLKSAGTQLFSYTYVADAVSAVLYCLFYGQCGEAYNVADTASDITLRDLAGIIADCVGTKVVFDLPDATESAGYSKATKAIMDSQKLRSVGWSARYDMRTGLEQTLRILKED
jgi:nucleoside-diphosphate-sugar epimerase